MQARGGGTPLFCLFVCLRLGDTSVYFARPQALIGGTAGVVGTLLYRGTGGAMAIGIYVSVLALSSALCIRVHWLRLHAHAGPDW